MVPKLSKRLSEQQFASLLTVGNSREWSSRCHLSARLIGLGYMMDLAGRLRMTGRGRSRIAAGFETSHRLL